MRRQPVDKLNDELRGLILFVKGLESRITGENLNGEQVKAAFAEMYSILSVCNSYTNNTCNIPNPQKLA